MLTCDPYYLVKNTIYSILLNCPEVLGFFKIMDIRMEQDIFFNESETLKRDPSEIFVRFVKKLRELKLDYNIVLFFANVDRAFDR